MQKASRRLVAAPLVLGALAASAGAANAARVTFRAEGTNRTLVEQTVVSTPSRAVSRGGSTSCAGSTGLGVLDVATRGSWDGQYFSFGDYQITEIARERHPGTPTYYSLWFNGKSAQTGLCGITPENGDSILLLPDRGNGTHFPLELRSPRRAVGGRSFRVRVLVHDFAGRTKPVSGARVRGGGLSARTNANGYASITPRRAGRLTLKATKAGLTRSEADTVRVAR